MDLGYILTIHFDRGVVPSEDPKVNRHVASLCILVHVAGSAVRHEFPLLIQAYNSWQVRSSNRLYKYHIWPLGRASTVNVDLDENHSKWR